MLLPQIFQFPLFFYFLFKINSKQVSYRICTNIKVTVYEPHCQPHKLTRTENKALMSTFHYNVAAQPVV